MGVIAAVIGFMVGAIVVTIVLWGSNALAMYGMFTRETPVVTGSAIYRDNFLGIYVQVDGVVHNVEIVEIAMHLKQALKTGATPPEGFRTVETQEPLCSSDRVSFIPFQRIPPRDLTGEGNTLFSGTGHYVLWCGRFRVHHGPPNVLKIPCERSLDEPPRIGIRYRYSVGFLAAEEYHDIEASE
ncbi:MAG: hypothetical protein SFV18_18270 [Bryobacteraceae bacterium]|nr:hypothetical protein [Bryobacteraceae bacterium]